MREQSPYYYEAFGKAAGLYLDDNTNNTTCEFNTFANGQYAGLLIHNAYSNVIANNTFYNSRYQLLIVQNTAGAVKNLTLTGNKFVAKETTQKAMLIQLSAADNPVYFGSFSNNCYARPINDNSTMSIDEAYSGGRGIRDITLAQWQSEYKQDASSKGSPAPIDNLNKIRFDYNYSSSPSTVNFSPNFWSDMTPTTYLKSVTLPAFSGAVLIQAKTGPPVTTTQVRH